MTHKAYIVNIENRFKNYGFCDIFITCKETDHVSEIFWLTVNFLVPW